MKPPNLHSSLQHTTDHITAYWLHASPCSYMSESEDQSGGEEETVKYIVYCTLYIVKDRPVLSSERVPHIKKPQWSDSNKNLVISPRWGLDTKTDWPTDRRS
jgi:hypothetical protein